MATTKANLVVLGGAGLIAANVWFGPAPGSPLDLGGIWPYFTDPSSGVSSTKAHRELTIVVGGLVGVWVLSMLAEASDAAADACLAFVYGLVLLWLIMRASGANGASGVFRHTKGGTAPSSSTGSSSSSSSSSGSAGKQTAANVAGR